MKRLGFLIVCFVFLSQMFLGEISVTSAQILDSSDIIGGSSKIISGTDLQDLVTNSDAQDARGFKALMEKLAEYTKQFTVIIGIIILVYAGIQLIISRGDEEVFKSKIMQLVYMVIGYTVLLMAQTIVYQMFFGEYGEIMDITGGTNYATFAQNTLAEMQGLYDYATMFAIAVLLLFVIIALIRYMVTAENDEGKDALWRQVIYGSIGILLLGAANRIITIFFSDKSSTKSLEEAPDITAAGAGTIFGEIVGWMNFLLGYVAFMAIISLIVAGAMMIFYFGDDDRIEKAKSIIKYTVVALVLCFSGWVMINYFFNPV